MNDLKKYGEYKIKESFKEFEKGNQVVYIRGGGEDSRSPYYWVEFVDFTKNKYITFEWGLWTKEEDYKFDSNGRFKKEYFPDFSKKFELLRVLVDKDYNYYQDVPQLENTFSSKENFIHYFIPYLKSFIEGEKGLEPWFSWFHRHEKIFQSFFSRGEFLQFKYEPTGSYNENYSNGPIEKVLKSQGISYILSSQHQFLLLRDKLL